MPYPSSVDANQVQEWIIGSDALELSAGGTVNTLSANAVYLMGVKINGQTTISNMRTHIGTVSGPGKTDMGIYDSNGNLLAHTGAIANTASSPNTNPLSGGNYTLVPGLYYIALANDNGLDQYSRTGALTVPGALSNARTATNTATAGVLPATLGAILAPSGAFPCWCGVAVNGLP